jgi:hypothetical protein
VPEKDDVDVNNPLSTHPGAPTASRTLPWLTYSVQPL